MNTKEAIEFVKQMTNAFKCIGDYNCSDIDKKQNEIIALLQQGEEKLKEFIDPVKTAEEVNEWAWWALFVTAVVMTILFILKILGKI